MPRAKKPDAPKFEPVFIAGYRQEVHSLATPEDERKKMIDEDDSRIMLERATVAMQRLGVLHRYLGLPGKPGDNCWALLIAVANKYVDEFEVKVGAQPKPGRKKVGDRFKTVTEIESVKILRNLPYISHAIEAVAAERQPRMSAMDLNTKYYACLSEIEANKYAVELLRFWRETCTNRPDLAHDAFFDTMFWACERDQFGATMPHNVTLLKTRKR